MCFHQCLRDCLPFSIDDTNSTLMSTLPHETCQIFKQSIFWSQRCRKKMEPGVNFASKITSSVYGLLSIFIWQHWFPSVSIMYTPFWMIKADITYRLCTDVVLFFCVNLMAFGLAPTWHLEPVYEQSIDLPSCVLRHQRANVGCDSRKYFGKQRHKNMDPC